MYLQCSFFVVTMLLLSSQISANEEGNVHLGNSQIFSNSKNICLFAEVWRVPEVTNLRSSGQSVPYGVLELRATHKGQITAFFYPKFLTLDTEECIIFPSQKWSFACIFFKSVASDSLRTIKWFKLHNGELATVSDQMKRNSKVIELATNTPQVYTPLDAQQVFQKLKLQSTQQDFKLTLYVTPTITDDDALIKRRWHQVGVFSISKPYGLNDDSICIRWNGSRLTPVCIYVDTLISSSRYSLLSPIIAQHPE